MHYCFAASEYEQPEQEQDEELYEDAYDFDEVEEGGIVELTECSAENIPERFAWLRQLASSGAFIVERADQGPRTFISLTPREAPVEGLGRITVELFE